MVGVLRRLQRFRSRVLCSCGRVDEYTAGVATVSAEEGVDMKVCLFKAFLPCSSLGQSVELCTRCIQRRLAQGRQGVGKDLREASLLDAVADIGGAQRVH
jgi:hypothetical protein